MKRLLMGLLMSFVSLPGIRLPAQGVDCETSRAALVIRAAPIDPAPHVSPEVDLTSQPIFVPRGGRADAYVTVVSRLPDDSPGGPRGGIYVVIVAIAIEGNLRLAGVTHAGTVLDAHPEGLSMPDEAMIIMETIDPARNAGLQGAILRGMWLSTTLPLRSSATLFRLTLEAPATAAPAGRIVFRDGLVSVTVPQGAYNEVYVPPGPVDDLCLVGTTIEEAGAFRRGDANDDGTVDISDPITVLSVLFLGQADLLCRDAGDANDDGGIDVSDPIYTFGALFLGGPAIPPPFEEGCGIDPKDDILDCRTFRRCP